MIQNSRVINSISKHPSKLLKDSDIIDHDVLQTNTEVPEVLGDSEISQVNRIDPFLDYEGFNYTILI